MEAIFIGAFSLTRGRFDLSFLQSVQHSEVDEACLKELELIQIALAEAQRIVEGFLLRCLKVNKPVPAEHKLLQEGPIET